MKKIFVVVFSFLFFSTRLFAGDSAQARIGKVYYDTLYDAIEAAKSDDVIVLLMDIPLSDMIVINKTVHIDMNGKTISRSERPIEVHSGDLILQGKGTVKEINPTSGAVVLKGSNDINDTYYTNVTVGENVTLEGFMPLMVTPYTSGVEKVAYGVVANVDGTLISKKKGNDTGASVYINGQIGDKDNYPLINLNSKAKLISEGQGIYAAGYAEFVINGADIRGIDSGIAIKSGKFNILNATVLASGEDTTPTEGYGEGINSSGAAIQIESNSGYAGDIDVSIKGGTFTSQNGITIYEYIGNGTETQVSDFEITGGTFNAGKKVFALSEKFTRKMDKFISGGTFNKEQEVDPLLKAGYRLERDGSVFKVQTVGLFSSGESSDLEYAGKKKGVFLYIIFGLGIIFTLWYLNKKYKFLENLF